jgi:uncharacterized protein (UPF0335 family)
MPKYLTPEEKIPTDIKDLVDRMGRLHREIEKRAAFFKKMRVRLLQMKKQGRILGQDYKVVITQFETVGFDIAKLKRIVPAATLKKCRSITEKTRLTFTARKSK